jgi:folylpolyglutamate synthase/dihydropteroate synthase
MIEIAKNKFGTISHNNVVFHLKFDREIEELSHIYEREYSAKFIESFDYFLDVDYSDNEPIFSVSTQFGNFKLNMLGKRAAENSVLAFTAFNYLINDARRYLHTIEKVRWPGRMEKIDWEPNCSIFLSGDHNPQGILSLLEILRYYKYKRIYFVVGICSDKNHSLMLSELFDFPNSEIYLTETPHKTLPIDKYDQRFLVQAKYVSRDPIDVLKTAIADSRSAIHNNNEDSNIIVVTGSLYLVGLIYATRNRVMTS